MHHRTDKITHSMAFLTPVVEHWLEREINITNFVVCVYGLCDGAYKRTLAAIRKELPM